MHITTITMKAGHKVTGYLELFRPEEGYLKLLGFTTKYYFKDMQSCITEGERISVNQIGDMDEIDRARKHMADARKYGWHGITADTPKQEWE